MHFEWTFFLSLSLSLHFMVFTRNLRSVLFFSFDVCLFVPLFSIGFSFAHSSDFKAKHLNLLYQMMQWMSCCFFVFLSWVCCIFSHLFSFAVYCKRCLLFDISAKKKYEFNGSINTKKQLNDPFITSLTACAKCSVRKCAHG